MGKLVRDKIRDIIRRDGRIPRVIALTEDDHRSALTWKLREEVDELLAADGGVAVLGEGPASSKCFPRSSSNTVRPSTASSR